MVCCTYPFVPIRFDNSAYEFFRRELFFLTPLPWAIAAWIGVLRYRPKTWIIVVSLIPVTVVTLTFILLFLMHSWAFSAMLRNDENMGIAKKFNVGQHRVEVIQTGKGEFHELQEVRRIIPGIKVVRHLASGHLWTSVPSNFRDRQPNVQVC